MEQMIEAKIEALRHEMMETAQLHGDLTHKKVVWISQRLDKYIVVYQNLMNKKDKQMNRTSA